MVLCSLPSSTGKWKWTIYCKWMFYNYTVGKSTINMEAMYKNTKKADMDLMRKR